MCSSGAFLFKEVSLDFLTKQHDIIFGHWKEDARGLSRILRAKGRYNSTYGMRQFVEKVSHYVVEFLAAVEKDLAAEAGAGTAADLQRFLLEFLIADQVFLVEKLASAFPDRVGSSYLENVLAEGRATIKSQYNKFSLNIFGSLVEE